MKWIQALILICLIVVPGVQADSREKSGKKSDPLTITLLEYEKQGYQIIGPVQYLGKTNKKLLVFRHTPVTYTRLKTIAPDGKAIVLKKDDFVYLLSKRKNIVLVRIKKKEADNV